MGSSHSVISAEAAVALVVVAGAVGFGYKHLAPTHAHKDGQASRKAGKKKKTMRNKGSSSPVERPAPISEPPPLPPAAPQILPGGFHGVVDSDAAPEPSKRSKSKKKKGKPEGSGQANTAASAKGPAETQPEAAPSPPATEKPPKSKQSKKQPQAAPPVAAIPSSSTTSSPDIRSHKTQSSASVDTDSSWTRVESRRTRVGRNDGPALEITTTSASEADAAAHTGTSSPVTERTDEDREDLLYYTRGAEDSRRPLAERLAPKPRKTGVADMVETPDHPTLSRVMRVKPREDEAPAAGFSWGDYEDRPNDGDAEGDDDESGWSVMKSRRITRPARTDASPSSSQTLAHKAPETLTKRQRQNAAKRDAQKSAKIEADQERLAQLAKHRKAQEKERMTEQQAKVGKKVSGGMKATVDEGGKLVWE